MTWLRFKTLILRLNAIVLIGGWLAFWGYGLAVGDVPPLSVVPRLIGLSLSVLLCLNLAVLGLLMVVYMIRYCHWKWQDMTTHQKSVAYLGAASACVALALFVASVLLGVEIGPFALIAFLTLFGAMVWLVRLLPQAMARDRDAFRLFRE